MHAKYLSIPTFVVALSVSTAAQEVRCLLAEDAPLPGVPGHTIDSISNTAVNGLGGYACRLNSGDGVTTLSHAWGSASGLSGSVAGPLQTEGTIGPYVQSSFEGFFGIDDAGTVCYSATADDTVGGVNGLDGVWLGDTPVAIEGDPIPSLPGKVWRFGSRPGVTRDGQPFWAGGINDAGTGTNEGEGLFLGLGATVVYKGGDTPTGAPAPIAPSGIDFDYAFSEYGTHHLTGVELALSTLEDYTVVMDGAALFLGGAIVREGQPLPAAIGGLPGENWDNFDFYGVNEAGNLFFTGDTDGATATDEFVVKDGVVLHREGDVLDGRVLTGAIEGAAMNGNGELAFVLDIEDPGGALEALFFEGALLLAEGDAVDITGDGVPDPGATIANFTGIAAVTLGPKREVYFTADVDTLGTSSSIDDVECFFVAEAADWTPCCATNAGQVSVDVGYDWAVFLEAGAGLAGDLYLAAGSITGTAPGIPFGGFTVPLNPDPYFLFTISQPNVPPLVDTLGFLGPDGDAVAQLQFPGGLDSALVGITVSNAYVVLDLATLSPLYVSTAAEFTFAP